MVYSSGVDISHSYPDYNFPIMIPSFFPVLSPWSFHFNQLSSSFIILTWSHISHIFPSKITIMMIIWSFFILFMGNSMNFPSFSDFWTIPFHSSQPSPPSAGTPATAAVPRLAAAPTSPPARFTWQGRHGWPGAGGRSVGAAAKQESWGWNYGKSMKIYDTIWLFVT